MELFSLEGRVAWVTGAGRGIGRAIAQGLAAHGAKVVCSARTQSQLDETVEAIKAEGGDALAKVMDVADLFSIQKGVEAVISHYGRIDILVNNAGMVHRALIVDMTEEQYDQVMGVNLKGLYFLSQAVVKHMIPCKYGKVINIASQNSTLAILKRSVYVASKGGVGQLTKAQALEWAPYGIRANALCPGFVLTPLSEKTWSLPKMKEWVEDHVPLGRLATPADMVGTAVFLASSASDYITGQLIYVEGGLLAGVVRPADR